MRNEPHILRPMTVKDLKDVDQIADVVHTSLPERTEVFEEKFNLFSRGCFVFEKEGNVVGYAISHPWMLDSIPALDSFLISLPTHPNCLYLHDTAILESARGFSATDLLMDRLKTVATHVSVEYLALVSVYGTNVLWQRHGFKIRSNTNLNEKLKSYGVSAHYMVAKI
jgi:N-acetylglutamate synthase-like GNAT family acetyltransferase